MRHKEILAGAGLALVFFLLFLGYNQLTPLFLLAGMGGALYFLIGGRGMAKLGDTPHLPPTGVGFEDIGGQASAKQELREALEFIKKPEAAERLGIRQLKGVLLSGPPGTGKTMLARAAAAYTDAIFLATSGSEFVEMYAGVGAQRVRSLFRKAREAGQSSGKKRAIIFVDELEVLGGKRGSHTGHLEYDQTLNQLLVEMDGLKQDSEIRLLVLGATNRADMLDPALLRPGRFDRQVRVELPDKSGRLQILQLHARNKPLAEDANLEAISRETFGFSGAHLESLTNEAAILALREGLSQISQRHLKEAVDKVMLGEKMDRKPDKTELQRVAIHEAGHALISEVELPGSVSLLSIISRSNALGYIRQAPQDDFYLETPTQMGRRIRVCLAGALAEELLLGEKSTGALGDYKEAVRLAQKLIQAGLSPLGVVDEEALPSRVQHRAMKGILEQEELRTKEILGEYRQQLAELADKALEEECLPGEVIQHLLAESREVYGAC